MPRSWSARRRPKTSPKKQREQRSHSWQPTRVLDVKLRAQLFGREVDEMLSAHQAHIPRADLHGEGTVV